MAKVAVVDFLLDAKGIQSINVDLGGDTPVAIILISTGHDSANDANSVGTNSNPTRMGPMMSVALATASATHHGTELINHNSSTQVSQTGYYTDRLFYTGSTFSQDWEIYLNSVGPDEVELNVVNAPITLGLDRRFTMIVFAGSDCEAHVHSQNLGTGTSAIDITAPGFEPDIVFSVCTYKTATGLTGSGAGFGAIGFGVGLNDGSDTQRAACRREGSGTLTVARSSYAVFDNCINALIQGGTSQTTLWRITIGSYDSSGYSITPSASAASALASFLAIKAPGVQFALDDFLTASSTGAESYGGLAFEPDILLVAGGGATAINTPTGNTTATASNYMGVVSLTNDAIHILRNRQGSDPSQASDFSIFNTDQIISLGDTVLHDVVDADFAGFTSDGFDMTYNTAPATQYLFLGLAIQSNNGTPPAADATNSGLIFVVT